MGAPQGGRGWAGGNLIGGIAGWVGVHLIGSPSLVVGSQVVTHVAGRPCEVAGRLANPAGAWGWSSGPLHAVGRHAAAAYLNWHGHPGLLQTVFLPGGRPRSDQARGDWQAMSPRNPLQDTHSHS